MIPLDSSFIPTMLFLAAPIIVHDMHDIIISELVLNLFEQWFGLIVFIVGSLFFTKASLRLATDQAVDKTSEKIFKIIIIFATFSTTISFISGYPLSAAHFAFLGIFVATFFYSSALYEHCFGSEAWYRQKSKDKLQLFIICVVLVLLMNDWSMAVRSMIDGTFWHLLLWNTVHFSLFALYYLWAIMVDAIQLDFSQRLMDPILKGFGLGYATIIFVTLYEPYCLNK